MPNPEALIRSVVQSEYSDFYARLYKRKPLPTPLRWERVPFLERVDIQAVPMAQRTFVPMSDISVIRATSGTSGGGIMLIPRMHYTPQLFDTLQRSIYEAYAIARRGSFSGAQFAFAPVQKQSMPHARTFALDPSDMTVSAALIRLFKADMLDGTAHALSHVARFLSEEDAARIKVLYVFGEMCTRLQEEYLRTMFPSADVYHTYASIELQQTVAASCNYGLRARDGSVHFYDSQAYVELIDTETGELIQEEGRSGELVLTTIFPAALPLVRYRTGDMARVARTQCPCGARTPAFFIEGRRSADRIRIAGGELNLVEIDRVLALFSLYMRTPDFQVRVGETVGEDGVLPTACFHLAWNTEAISAEDLAERIARELRVAPQKTYSDGVASGDYAPLTVEAWKPSGGGKQKRLVRDVSEVRNPVPLTAVQRVLEAVTSSGHSDFYRNHFAAARIPASIHSDTDWEKVPLLMREDIVSVPFWKRVFTDASRIDAVRNTFGTSGRRILIMPRTFFGSYEHPFHIFRGLRLMNFFAGCHYDFPRGKVEGTRALFGDVGNLEASARMAKLDGTNVLWTTPYTALAFADLLDEYDLTRSMRVVLLTGERCSPLQFETLQKRYPNALVITHYATSEVREHVAIACEHGRAAGRLTTLQAAPEVFIELVDPASGKAIREYDVPGEVAVTTLDPSLPFPFIRYCIGDVGVYRKRTCACDEERTGFEIVGRQNVFPVRLVRGELTISAMEAALAAIPDISSDYFEVHYAEEANQKSVLPRVRLVVVGDPHAHAPEEIARTVEENLRVFPTYTYAQGVKERLYLPIIVSIIEAPPPPKGGFKRAMPFIMRHMAGSDEAQKITIADAKKRL